MNKHSTIFSKSKVGFTIIEVVLVLAIAGLIFLMVFIALPALQRNQRNTQYRNNVAIAVTMVRNYQTNNRGQLPPADDTISMYVGRDSGSEHPLYNYVQNSGLPDDTFVKVHNVRRIGSNTSNRRGRISIMPNAICAEYSAPFTIGQDVTEASPGKISIFTVLEEGDNGMIFCQDV